MAVTHPNIFEKPGPADMSDGVMTMTMTMRHSGMVQQHLSETWPHRDE